MVDFMLKNKHILFLILLAIFCVFISYFYIGYNPSLGSDATEFKEAGVFLSQGGQVSREALMNRVIPSPLFLYISIVVNYFLNDFASSFSIVNMFFYILCIFAFYFLALEIYKEKKVAVISTVLVLFNFYVIDPGNAHLADMSGWFFLILSTYLAIKYIDTFIRKYYYFAILFAVIGFFFKEYGGLGLINLALLILVSDLPKRQKVKDILGAVVLSAIPIFSYHIFAFFQYHVSYFDKFINVVTNSPSNPDYQSKSLVLLIKILGWLFSFGWFAFLFGAWEEWKIKDKRRLKILLACFPATLTFLIWPAITQRLAVILMFWLSLITGFGLSRVRWYILYPFLGLYIAFNYNIKILIDKINLPF
ncbi:MAG: glycosyltransferase family 39 protein [Candidatus Paceibacterota bacterium]|jgi:hypothetical protein